LKFDFLLLKNMKVQGNNFRTIWFEEKLAGLKLTGRQSPRAGQKIINSANADEIIGEVTSGSFAPTLGYSIAFAYVKSDYTELGTEVKIATGRKLLSATVVKTPFYINPEARK